MATATLIPITAVVGASAAQAVDAVPTSTELGEAIVAEPGVLTGAAYVKRPNAAATMVATTPVAGFPRGGSSFAILSSGKAADAYTANNSEQLTTDFHGTSKAGGTDRDVTILRLDLNVPAGINCMTGLDFRFFSEEFPEYVGDSYNDAFIAELDTNSWSTAGSSITAPDNFAFDSKGNPISINAAGAASMTKEGADGTTYDGGSDLLTAATPITPGAHSIYLSIFDQGDGSYDSTVFVDNLRLGTVANVATDCKPGAAAATPAVSTVTVTPAAPTRVDPFGTAHDLFSIPSTTGVDYEVSGSPVAAGDHPGTGSVVVTAVAKPGYQLAGTTTWTLTFTDERAADLTSTGVGTDPQHVTLVQVPDGVLTLLDADGHPTTTIVATEGTYELVPATGVVTFRPADGWSGTAPGVTYRVTESDDRSSTAHYVPTVTKPAGPSASPLTSTEPAATKQTVTVPGGRATLLGEDDAPVTEVVVPGKGTYRAADDGSELTFVPVDCFAGAVPAAAYGVRDSYGQRASSTYTATVTAPAAPAAQTLTTSGVGTSVQQTTVTIPRCGSARLVDAGPDGTLEMPDAGTFSFDATTGELRFVPVLGYAGSTPAITVSVHDGFGATVPSTWVPTVGAPAAPTPVPVTSDGTGTAPQHGTVTLPAHTRITLLDRDGTPATSVTVRGQGTYVLDPETGTITFTAVLGFAGQPTPVDYRLTDAYGQSAVATYTPAVAPPSIRTPDALSSTGVGTQVQTSGLTLRTGDSVRLLSAVGDPVLTVTVPQQGTYLLDPATGTITFTPVFGFAGQPTPVAYRLTDAYGQSAQALYAPAVALPPTRTPDPVTSTGVGTQPQSATPPLQTGESIVLISTGGDEVGSVSIPRQGTYLLDPVTGAISFVPVAGFQGAATPVTFQVTDAYGQKTVATYAATVSAPPAPAVPPATSTGSPAGAQQVNLAVPAGGSVTLLDASGRPQHVVVIPHEGTYRLDPATGVASFEPVPGFHGRARAVSFVITDAYGQEVRSTYRAEVAGSVQVRASTRSHLRSTGTRVPVTCHMTGGVADRCTVVLQARVGGTRTVIGRGTAHGSGARIKVAVTLNAVGRALLATTPGGIKVAATARVRATTTKSYDASVESRVVGRRVALRPVYFASDSATLADRDRAYLLKVRSQLGRVKAVTCEGYADSRASVTFNEALGRARAAAVCAVLTTGRSVSATLRSLGESRPAATNATTEGRALNRRAEVTLRY